MEEKLLGCSVYKLYTKTLE